MGGSTGVGRQFDGLLQARRAATSCARGTVEWAHQVAVLRTTPFSQLVAAPVHSPGLKAMTIVHEDPVRLVRELKRQPGRDIWLCGGADLAAQLVDEIDEYHLKVNPVLIGAGIPLLARATPPLQLELNGTRVLSAGVQLNIYRRKDEAGERL